MSDTRRRTNSDRAAQRRVEKRNRRRLEDRARLYEETLFNLDVEDVCV